MADSSNRVLRGWKGTETGLACGTLIVGEDVKATCIQQRLAQLRQLASWGRESCHI